MVSHCPKERLWFFVASQLTHTEGPLQNPVGLLEKSTLLVLSVSCQLANTVNNTVVRAIEGPEILQMQC